MNIPEAMELNRMILDSPSSKPHEKDLARMRMRIIRRKKKTLKQKKENSHGRG